MKDLVQFLRDRLAEAERSARRGYYSDTHWESFTTTAHLNAWKAWRDRFPRDQWDTEANDAISEAARDGIRERITAHEADRTEQALREVEAGRAVIGEWEYWEAAGSKNGPWARACRYLARVYASHPDYRQEWRP